MTNLQRLYSLVRLTLLYDDASARLQRVIQRQRELMESRLERSDPA